MEAIIQLQKLVKGKDDKVLIFEGYIPNYDNSRLSRFVFDGDSICYTNSSITEVAKLHLAEQLRDEFGEAPYDYQKAKKVFGGNKIYTLRFC